MNNKENSIFNRKICWFSSMRDQEPKDITLGEFLAKGNEYLEQIERLRSCRNAEERKFIKSKLPQATISGIFRGGRKAENLVQHSGLICIDIDAKDNPDIENFDLLKESLLSRIDEVAFASLSVSGKGYYAILKLAYPSQHIKQFRALQKDFKKFGITLDGACSDVTRLRCLSYDNRLFINDAATPYKGVEQPKIIVPKIYPKRNNFDDNTDELVYMACQEIKRRHIDMTDNYADWISIGLALASLGEDGRDYFHIVSEQNPKYNQSETDRKYDGFLRSNSGRVTIGTFIYFCKRYGVW